ncbi:hypothetical protein SCHPADRAFT_106669 [Schizopora paradoxa]|uniref:Uncharacterized protein n=1 Tax=Schizopora paradoxa TaxID=27342 RepID=A0A0H2S3Y3_9AGAM|nr:hypothetical protein SCHPADRAFT_106669 [Schizopora paradoxa]
MMSHTSCGSRPIPISAGPAERADSRQILVFRGLTSTTTTTMNGDRHTLRRTAKRTLGRLDSDERPISAVYLAHLRHFLAEFPAEDNFRIGLDSRSGRIQCLVCNRNIPAGNGEPEEDGIDIFGSIANYQDHLKTDVHIRRKTHTSSITKSPNVVARTPAAGQRASTAGASSSKLINSPAPPTANEETLGTRANNVSAKPSPVLTRSSPTTPMNKAQEALSTPHSLDSRPRTVPKPAFQTGTSTSSAASSSSASSSSGRLEHQDVDQDYLFALSLQRELDEQDRQVAEGNMNSYNQTPYTMPAETIDLTNDGEGEELLDSFPFDEIYRAQLDGIMAEYPQDAGSYLLFPSGSNILSARCRTCNFSVDLPASGSLTQNFDTIMEGMGVYKQHLDLPHHLRKRSEAIAIQQGGPYVRESSMPVYPSAPTPSSSLTPVRPTMNTMAHPMTPVSLGKRKMEETEYDIKPFMHSGFAPPQNTYNAHAPAFASPSRFPQAQINDENGYHPRIPQGQHLPSSSTNATVRPFDEMHVAKWDGYHGQHSRGLAAGDFAINYDEERPLRQEAPVDEASQEEQFKNFMRKALDEFENNVTVSDALQKLGLNDRRELLDGMAMTLMAHQLIGVCWMVDQENDREKRGGILADAMGLGKTVQMIGTMVKNRPRDANAFVRSRPLLPPWETHGQDTLGLFDKGKSKEITTSNVSKEPRTTLILAPASLLQQWFEEINDKTQKGVFRVHIHHGKDKLKEVKQLESYDVIITSYHTLLMDAPKHSKDDFDTQPGPLIKARWLRVVIDEAQNIRNKGTRISIAVTELDAKYRWTLTGTPVTNNLGDIYGLIRFLGFKPYNDWKTFNDQIGKVQKRNPARAGQRAQAVLKPHLLRRTKDSTIDGQPLIQLGPKVIEVVELEFDRDEREMYNRMESRSKQLISKYFKEKTVMKHYDMILVMILRLRQLCGHPFLVTERSEDGEDANKPMDGKTRESELERATRLMDAGKFQNVQDKFRDRVNNRLRAEATQAEIEHEECPVCFEPLLAKHRVVVCGHEFCTGCINEVLHGGEGREVEEEGAQCPMCRKPFDASKHFDSSIFEPVQEVASGSDDRPAKRQKMDDVDRIFEEETDLDEELVPSTKMKHMLDTVVNTLKSHPNDKTIVYSQWTSMLDLVDQLFRANGVKTLPYNGRMNRIERADAISKFKDDNGPPVLLVRYVVWTYNQWIVTSHTSLDSLKCGGVGLNLTCANRVINLDLAWNYATEAQAYDRVHRIGQLKDVVVHRLIIKDTIEERLVRLQAKKQGFSDAALGEGTSGKLKRMTAREIANLFGLNV